MEWVNVKDRLPKHKTDVLVWMTTPLHWSNAKVMGVCRYNELGFWENLSFTDMEPTHWMPLPEPPKE